MTGAVPLPGGARDRDKTGPSVMAALDVTLRRQGGAPTYVLTDNENTVTVEPVAGMPVADAAMVAWSCHYGVTIHTCTGSSGCVGAEIVGA